MKSAFFTLLTITFFSASAFAQSGGTITGIITDKTNRQPVLGANVFVIETGRGDATTATGEYKITELEPGTYSLRVSYLGYTSVTKTDIVVSNVSFTRVNFDIEPADLELETIEVTTSYYQKNTDNITSLNAFSFEEIRRAPGGQEDIVRAISVVPGVATQSGGRNDLVVRGGGPSENLFLIDGLEVPNINHFGTQGATGGPLTLVNVDFVDNTEFATGGFGARYGDRLSSVLNISLREGRQDRWGSKTNLSATGFGANIEGPVGQDGNFLFSARRSYLDFIFKAAGFGFIPEYWDFQGKYVQRIDDKNKLQFFGIGALDNVSFDNANRKNRLSNSQILGSDQNQYVIGGTWQHVTSAGLMNITLGRNYVDFSSAQADTNQVKIFDNQAYEAENSIRAEMITRLTPKVEMTVGGQYKLVQANSKLIVNAKNPFGDVFNVNEDNDLTAHKASFYLQAAHDWAHGFDYTVGLRADYFSAIKNELALSPRVSLGFNLNELNRFTASAGLYHQSPSYTWLANNSNNQNLNHLQSIQTVLGYEHMFRADTKFRVEAYYKDYKNYPASTSRTYLVLANTGAGFGGQQDGFASFGFDDLVSKGTGFSRGLEFQIQKKLSEVKLYGIASLSLNEVFFTPLDGKEYRGSYSQPIIFNLSGGYQFANNYELGLKFRMASGLPYTPFNSDGTQNVSEYNQKTLDLTHQLDVRVDKRWNFTAWNLITYIDIQNIYGQENQFSVQWDLETQQVRKGSSIGVLPTIGITAEF
ncbi:MAG: TonB-dependent receptor [Bacteroidetes bacterium]|nr:TonB-dependent receptor [Bacteroidota bacterium]